MKQKVDVSRLSKAEVIEMQKKLDAQQSKLEREESVKKARAEYLQSLPTLEEIESERNTLLARLEVLKKLEKDARRHASVVEAMNTNHQRKVDRQSEVRVNLCGEAAKDKRWAAALVKYADAFEVEVSEYVRSGSFQSTIFNMLHDVFYDMPAKQRGGYRVGDLAQFADRAFQFALKVRHDQQMLMSQSATLGRWQRVVKEYRKKWKGQRLSKKDLKTRLICCDLACYLYEAMMAAEGIELFL